MLLNKVEIIGYLGGDPELKTFSNGDSVCNFSVATTEKWKDKDNNPQERTEWHKIVVRGKQAEHCNTYLAKGRMVFVQGKNQTRKYTDNAGVEKYVTEVVVSGFNSQVLFLGGAGQQNGQAPQQGRGAAPAQGRGSYQGRVQQQTDDGFDDVPF